eukprot:9645134-Karenia_brevis.AAC.1
MTDAVVSIRWTRQHGLEPPPRGDQHRGNSTDAAESGAQWSCQAALRTFTHGWPQHKIQQMHRH